MALDLSDRKYLEYRVETARLSPQVLTGLLRTYLGLPHAVAATEAIKGDRTFVVVLFESEPLPSPPSEWRLVDLPTVLIENFAEFGYATPGSIPDDTPELPPPKEIVAT